MLYSLEHLLSCQFHLSISNQSTDLLTLVFNYVYLSGCESHQYTGRATTEATGYCNEDTEIKFGTVIEGDRDNFFVNLRLLYRG